jgi:Clr5 domain
LRRIHPDRSPVAISWIQICAWIAFVKIKKSLHRLSEKGRRHKNDSLDDMQQQAQQQHQTPSPFPDRGSPHPHGPTAEEWDAVKDVIRQLYVIEQCPLKGVKSVLETRYNFRATYDKSSSKQHPKQLPSSSPAASQQPFPCAPVPKSCG